MKLPAIVQGYAWAHGPFAYGDLMLAAAAPSNFWADVDRDYDAGEGYILWTSKYLTVGESIIVRYAAAHTSSFSSELSTITVENHHVQIIINHVILMAYQERLAIQLQDPTAHTSTIQQMSDAVSKAEKVYLDSLHKALADLNTSERVEGWKVDKFDRIY